MTALSDTLTIALVIVLLFGSIAIYLYTRIQQAEQKINLLENILLDLKTTSEVKSYMELPAETEDPLNSSDPVESVASYKPFSSSENDETTATVDITTSAEPVSYKPLDVTDEDEWSPSESKTDSNTEISQFTSSDSTKMSVNYESMTLKELQSIAKQRGISGAGSMKKGPIIEALKTSDRVSNSETVNQIEPGSLSGTSSFVETSSFLTQE